MYKTFYNMTEKPFQISTDPRFLWLGEKHREALANLKYGLLDRNGFVVLTGDVGTGKTTLVNALLDALGNNVRVAKINHPSLETHEFLTLLAKTLDPTVELTDKSDLLLFLNAYLQQAYADGKAVLLIIDEAHRLSTDLLEEIRLLSNIEQAGQRLLSIIFVGQDEIKPILLTPQCRALRQRITSFYDIQALLPEETRRYVDYRLKVSGTLEKLFTEAALRQIHVLTRGNPRVINILCDRALLTGYVNERRVIDADIIIECSRELDLNAEFKTGKRRGAGPVFSTRWRTPFNKLSVMGKAAWNKLTAALDGINRGRNKAVAQVRSTTKALIDILWSAVRSIFHKYRQRIFPAALVSGIFLFFLVVTLSALSGAKLQGKASAAKQRQETDRAAHAMSGQTAQKPMGALQAAQDGDDQTAVASTSTTDASPVAPEPTLVDKAAAALARNDYQEALNLIEANPMGAGTEDADSIGLYSQALVGRAGEIMSAAPHEAEALLIKATEVAPKMMEPHLMLGKRYTRKKDYPLAIDAYQRAVGLDPKASDAFFNLGFLYATTGEFDAAEKAFERVVDLKPSYIGKSLFNLAVVQQKLGKTEQSIANLEEVVAMGPDNEKALAFLNRLRRSSTAGDAEPSR